MATTELAALKTDQKEKLKIQNRIWKMIEEHFDLFENNIHFWLDWDQLLFSREQNNLNYHTVSSLLAETFATFLTLFELTR